MARRRRAPATNIPARMVRQDPLTLEVVFPAGVQAQPVAPVGAPMDAPGCPYCGSRDVVETAHRGDPGRRGIVVYYYQCQKCVDSETRNLTRFKRRRPLGPTPPGSPRLPPPGASASRPE